MVDINTIEKTYIKKFDNERLDLFFKLFDFFTLIDQYSLLNNNVNAYTDIKKLAENVFHLESSVYLVALSERESVIKFFENVIDQPRYINGDGANIRKLLINWYSALKTLPTLMNKGLDPFFLSTEEIDLLIQSFGFPYPRRIISRKQKIKFLYNIIEYYHRKGTPYVFGSSLSHFGLQQVVVTEWWLNHNEEDGLYFKSKPVFPIVYKNNSEYIEQLSYDDFGTDIYWKQTKEQLLTALDNTSIKLPSITPYIDLYTSYDILKLRIGSSILATVFHETYTFWLEYVIKRVEVTIANNEKVPANLERIINNISEAEEYKFYLIGDSPTGVLYGRQNQILYMKSNGKYSLFSPTVNDCHLLKDTDTHSIYNGTEWVHFSFKFPDSLLNDTKQGTLYKPTVITEFNINVSVFEMLLILNWIFNSVDCSTDTIMYRYNNVLTIPFDKPDTVYNSRDNLIDDETNYISKIYDEYETKVNNEDESKILTYDMRNNRLNYFYDNFIQSFNKNSEDSIFILDNNIIEDILKVVNPQLKERIDVLLLTKTRAEILDLLLMDIERYLYETSMMFPFPFSFLTTGFDLFRIYKQIIDFFKPYRVRIHNITSNIIIDNRTEESVLNKNIINMEDELYFYDHIRHDEFRFDSSTVKESLRIKLEPVL